MCVLFIDLFEDNNIYIFIGINLIRCTIASEINGTSKGVYVPISKLHSILVIANLLAHNNLWLCYYGPVNSLRLKSNVTSIWACKTLGCTIYFAVYFLLIFPIAVLLCEGMKVYYTN